MANDFSFQAIHPTTGKLLFAPSYAPMVLVQVKTVTAKVTTASSAWTTPTTVPNANNIIVFYKNLTNSGGGRGIRFYPVDNSSTGFKDIKIDFSNNSDTYTFYIFSNFAPYIPDWGLYIYRDGKIIYTNCSLPLIVKTHTFTTSDTLFSVAGGAATPPVYRVMDETPFAGGTPGAWFIMFEWAYCGAADGIKIVNINQQGPYEGAYGGSGNYNLNCAYIETAIYDQYYEKSLGY